MLAGLGANAALALVERQGEALQARFAARRDNQQDAARLREAASRITDVDALLKDRRTLRVVLEAFQLESEIDKRAVLKRVLTEDPGERSSLVNRLPDPRWKALAEAVTAARKVDLTPEALAAAPVEDIRKLELNRMAGLDFLQVRALTEAQVKALSPDQIGAISAEAIGGMDAADLAALSGEQVAALGPGQARALLAWQVSAIEPADIPSLTPAALRAMTPDQLSLFTPAQMAALTEEQLGAFTGRQVGGFADDQLAALTDRGRAILRSAPFLPDEPPAAARGPLADPRVVERLVQGAMTNRFEKAMGEANPGMREALYFRRMAGEVTSIAQLMADRALLEVARGALGIPASFASLDFEQQRDLLTRRLDVAKLQDPKEVARMAGRYLATRQQPEAAQNPVLQLLGGGGGESLVQLAARRVSLSL
jgi:hypothetical protein